MRRDRRRSRHGREWEDSCDDTVDNGYCLLGGGSIVGMTNCDYKIGSAPATTFDDKGTRCCSP